MTKPLSYFALSSVAATMLWFYIFTMSSLTVVLYVIMCVQVTVIRKLYMSSVKGITGGAAGTSPGMWAEALKRADVLAAPITEVTTETDETKDGIKIVACGMQGWRRSMEDGHISRLDYPKPGHHILAVFDGHCGSETAEYCATNMPEHIEAALRSVDVTSTRAVEKALQKAFLNCDESLKKHAGKSGATACLVYITPTHVFCANAGDSRAVMSRDDGNVLIPLSTDHKPTNPSEAQRIRGARGFVWNRRVNGILALSRALGDYSFKQCPGLGPERQAVTAMPDVVTVERMDGNDDFVVVACDGIWDVLSSEQTVQSYHAMPAGSTPQQWCHHLFRKCLSPHPFGLGCDNMSVVVLTFPKGTVKKGEVPPPLTAPLEEDSPVSRASQVAGTPKTPFATETSSVGDLD
eukprot:PhF_6_TR5654/c2_g1_i2/m.8287/K14803/PTC2_3; protein phosphatase PTC2/3